eukprot:scaffold15769_cov125-Isochrysis_galbana.AAC.1
MTVVPTGPPRFATDVRPGSAKVSLPNWAATVRWVGGHRRWWEELRIQGTYTMWWCILHRLVTLAAVDDLHPTTHVLKPASRSLCHLIVVFVHIDHCTIEVGTELGVPSPSECGRRTCSDTQPILAPRLRAIARSASIDSRGQHVYVGSLPPSPRLVRRHVVWGLC